MRRKKHRKRKKKKHRFFLLFVLVLGLLIIILFLSDRFFQTNNMARAAFRWENYKAAAHALGGLDGYTYLNAKESFEESYRKGYRLFELDLSETSDGVWVCRHNWKEPMEQWKGEKKKVLSAEEFSSVKLYGTYTPMTLEEFFLLLKEYQDAFVLIDSKKYSVRDYQNTLEDYTQYREIAKNIGAEEVFDRLIPEIYNEEMYAAITQIYDFPSYLYSLWKEYPQEELEKTAAFCREKNIPAVTVSNKEWSEQIQRIFEEQRILVYVYTVNDLQEAGKYIRGGASGICTDVITEEELTLWKKAKKSVHC